MKKKIIKFITIAICFTNTAILFDGCSSQINTAEDINRTNVAEKANEFTKKLKGMWYAADNSDYIDFFGNSGTVIEINGVSGQYIVTYNYESGNTVEFYDTEADLSSDAPFLIGYLSADEKTLHLMDNYENTLIFTRDMPEEDPAEKLNQKKYNEAEALMESGDYDNAAQIYSQLGDFMDSEDKLYSIYSAMADSERASIINYLESIRSTLPRNVISSDHSWGHTVGITPEGKIKNDTIDVYNLFMTTAEWTNITAVAAGTYHISGLGSNGRVITICTKDDAENGLDTSDWSDIVDISAGTSYTVGLKSDGTVVASGLESKQEQCNVSGWTDMVAVSAAVYHTVGLKSDGTVVAVGQNTKGQCNVSGWTDIVDISAGAGYTIGLKSDGTVVATGSNDYGRCNVSGWTDIVAVSAGHGHTVGLKSDGTVVAVGRNVSEQCNVSDWTDIVAVSAGLDYTAGVRSDGTLVAVGNKCDEYGRFWRWENIKTK